jgi:hypothetical protein
LSTSHLGSILTSIEFHSLSQYKKRYAGYKNLKGDEWIEVFKEVEKRKNLGKDSEVYLYRRLVGKAKLQQKRRRYNKTQKSDIRRGQKLLS